MKSIKYSEFKPYWIIGTAIAAILLFSPFIYSFNFDFGYEYGDVGYLLYGYPADAITDFLFGYGETAKGLSILFYPLIIFVLVFLYGLILGLVIQQIVHIFNKIKKNKRI